MRPTARDVPTTRTDPSVVARLVGAIGLRHVLSIGSILVILALWQLVGPAQPLFAS